MATWIADIGVIGTLLLWHVIGAISSDDGYNLTIARVSGEAGYTANYFRYLRSDRSAVRLVPVGAGADGVDQHRRGVDAAARHLRRDRDLADPEPLRATAARPAARGQPGRGVDGRGGVPGRVAAVQQRAAARAADRVRHAGRLGAGGERHRHPPAVARRGGHRGGGLQCDARTAGADRRRPAAGRCAGHRPDHRPAPPGRRPARAARRAGQLAGADLRDRVPRPDAGHRRRIGAHQVRRRPDHRLVPGIPALLLPDRRGQCRLVVDPPLLGAVAAAVPVRTARGAAAAWQRARCGQRPGVAADRHDRDRAAAVDLHADEVGGAVRRVRRAGRRPGRGHRVRVRPRRPAQPPQPGAVRDRAAVRAGLGDLGHQRLVLRRQLRGAVVGPATGACRSAGDVDVPGAGDRDRTAGRLVALPDGLHRPHGGRQHPPQPGAGVDSAAGGRDHHGGARGRVDGQGRRPALSRLHHREGQRRLR